MKYKLPYFLKQRAFALIERFGYTSLKTARVDAIYRQLSNMFEVTKRNFQVEDFFDKTTAIEKKGISGIIFSKDRPMQIDALLRSYLRLVKNPSPLHILYKCSNSDFEQAYQKLIGDYNRHDVVFRRENQFKQDLIEILITVDTDKIYFLVDDIIIIEGFDLSALNSFDTLNCIFSLRLGKNIDYSYMLKKTINLPPLIERNHEIPHIAWKWKDGSSYWGYPLSLDGHVFSRKEILLIAYVSEFAAPNTFEISMQNFKYAFFNREGAAFNKAKIVNLPLNRVQNEFNNPTEELNNKMLLNYWQNGYRIQHEAFYKIHNHSCHEGYSIKLVR